MQRPLEQRFWEKVNREAPNGCWEWIGAKNSGGYGHIGWNKRVHGAHRVVWYLTHGRLPDMLVLHRCDNPGCVNPLHLFLGTDADNSADKIAKGRWRGHNVTGNAHWNTKIPVEALPQIAAMHASGRSMRSIAREYGVVHEAIRKILRGDRKVA